MRNFSVFIMMLLMLLPELTHAQVSFEASVNRQQVPVGGNFKLTLTLSGASTNTSPDVSALAKDFTIAGKNQLNNVQIINGNVTSERSWEYTLLPKREGTFTLPGFVIDTSEGKFSTGEIELLVSGTESIPKEATQGKSKVSIDTSVSKTSVYQGEMLVYTIKVTSEGDVYNPELVPPSADNALIAKLGDEEILSSVTSGITKVTRVMKYYVIPLASGDITIRPPVFKGKIASTNPVEMLTKRSFDMMRSFDRMMGFSDSFLELTYEPFQVAGKTATIKVDPPQPDVKPWIVAEKLELKDEWDTTTPKLGEAMKRVITLEAEGTIGKMLPNLTVEEAVGIRSYAEPAEVGDGVAKGGKTAAGWKRFVYTLIGETEGEVTVPEIRIPWWNVKKSQLEYAVIPEKRLNISQGIASPNKPPLVAKTPVRVEEKSEKTEPEVIENQTQGTVFSNHYHLMIAIIAGLFVLGMMWGVYWWRKAKHIEKHIKNDGKFTTLSLPDNLSVQDSLELAEKPMDKGDIKLLQSASTPETLWRALLTFGQTERLWQLYASPHDIIHVLIERVPDKNIEIKEHIEMLERAVFGKGTLEEELWKKSFLPLLKKAIRVKKVKKEELFPTYRPPLFKPLNPVQGDDELEKKTVGKKV